MADATGVSAEAEDRREGFVRGLGLLDSTMIVAGSMIGSGIFIVSSIIARQVGSPGWLLVVWIVTGLLTLMAALSYGELAAMMPKAGGQYVYLREAFSPMWGFLYGWTLFLVIQTGTIAAVAVGFARYTGVLVPWVSEKNYLIEPVRLGGYALSLSTAQLVGLLMIALLTFMNTRGLKLGKLVQNVFTVAKTGALIALIVLGIIVGLKSGAGSANFSDFWTVRGDLQDVGKGLTAAAAFGLFVGICVAQTNSLFSADAWNNITFTAGEVKNPRRNIPLSLALGTILVISLYLLANVAYLVALPFEAIQNAPSDRVASETANVIFPGVGATVMAVAIMISTFGCNNGLILAGARAYYAMARDGLFFRSAGELNHNRVPAWGLVIQGIWAAALVLPRTVATDAAGGVTYGNLYGNLLDYVISAALIFYILTIIGIFLLRSKRPEVERPYKAFGYPVVPALYVVGASVILVVLFVYQTATTWPGLFIVLTGIPVYFIWRKVGVPMEGSSADPMARGDAEA
ncbi:MAG: amino acid permease [Acidobacteria bacterium]|nr:amino acid permease [Acidobacteriota bacterium]MCA1643760.1 amino acid permease [Acidobacteriota bacterium]